MKSFEEFEESVNEAKVNESVGGALKGNILDLRDLIKTSQNASTIKPKDVEDMLKAVDELEAKFKKIFKGKGLSGW